MTVQLVPISDAAAQCGITYRQAMYWAKAGWLGEVQWTTANGKATDRRGSGLRAHLTLTQVRRMRKIATLTQELEALKNS